MSCDWDWRCGRALKRTYPADFSIIENKKTVELIEAKEEARAGAEAETGQIKLHFSVGFITILRL